MEWKEVRLGDYIKTNEIQYSIKENWENFVYLDTGSIIEGRIDKLLYFTKEDKLPSRARRKVQHGDIIYSCVRPNQRHYGYINIPVENLLVSTGFVVISCKNIDSKYLYYYLTQDTIINYLQNIGEQSVSTYPTIKPQDIEDIFIRIPSDIEDQRRIASILSSLDRKIELNNKINADLEEMAQAIFKNWFVDFEPFKDGKFVDSELGMIPEGWKAGRADDFYQINIGKTPPRKEHKWFSTNPADKIWVSIANMGNSGIFISDSSEYLTKEAVDRHNIIMVPRNTILLSFKLTVGRVAIADKELTTNEAIARFILSDDKYMEYLYLYLKKYDYNSLGSTSSIATAVNSKTIKGMQMLQPSDNVIDAFHIQVNPIFEKIRSLAKENSRLSLLRDTLLPRLMSGELEVPE